MPEGSELAIRHRNCESRYELAASGLPTDEPGRTEAKATVVTEVERLRRRIWNGKAKNAQKTFDRIREVIYWLWVSDFVDPVEIEQSVGGAGSLHRCDAP